eukprot:TRINITY_DN37152_c0_g1_i1.p1 TRINITY_DN37152_c0_g1~~TRINITY_DN37152_c0_g1_i1.p1  ORF type:complete len:617 (+),score=113.37 TRINITY_DN37152_c0_g1_i1:79-1929(+)
MASGYWNSSAWDPDSRVYAGANIYQTHNLAVQPENARPLATSIPAGQPSLIRGNSGSYWNASSWDADSRVYTGAMTGQTNHLMAVQPQPQANPVLPQQALATASVAATRQPSVQSPLSMQSVQAASPTSMQSSMVTPARPMSVHPAPVGGIVQARTVAPMISPSRSVVHAGNMQAAASRRIVTGPVIAQRSASSYWASSNWGAVSPSQAKSNTAASPAAKPQALKRGSSDAYWNADQWDPDNRVYTGAEAGQTNHMTAVLDKGEEKLIRASTMGLVSKSLGYTEKHGLFVSFDKPTELNPDGGAPTLKDLYEISSDKIGSGSFGVVRQATHRSSGSCCVVKAIPKTQAGPQFKAQVDAGMYEVLLRMSRDFPHENVVNYLDMIEGEEHYYVVMENLHGEDLLERVEREFPISESYCKNVMQTVLTALSHIHTVVGVCHRDIKLDNFRYREASSESSIVLLDFGFLCRLDQPWDKAKCGTKMYMSPELLGGCVQQAQLAATDVWAAGVILYVLFTGDSPFQPDDMPALAERGEMAQALRDKALHASELVSVSEEAKDLLAKLLDIDPSARITATQALQHPWLASLVARNSVPLTPSKAAYSLVRRKSQLLEDSVAGA